MAWRIADNVVRGEIDNRQKGCVCGRIWLVGRKEPLELELQGNALHDLAGSRLTFENPDPTFLRPPKRASRRREPGQPVEFKLQQCGIVGDMTASRKVRVPDVPVEEAYAMNKIGIKPPEHLANCLYLEWYSDYNGRVVIENADFLLSITEPVWKMSAQEQEEQRRANASAMERWLERLANTAGAAAPRKEDEAGESHLWTPEDDAPMDEFAWEKFLKASDERTDRYGKLLEQFKDLDEGSRERLIARAMGWTQIEAYLEARDKGEVEEIKSAPGDIDELPELEPNPLAEGIDWIRTADGDIQHPLAHRAFETVIAMSCDCDITNLSDIPENKPVQDMIFSAQMLGAKLAGALNTLAYDHETEDGFLVAYLKRALKYLHEALKYCEQVQQHRLVAPARLERFKQDLFSIREEILRLMKQYRKI